MMSSGRCSYPNPITSEVRSNQNNIKFRMGEIIFSINNQMSEKSLFWLRENKDFSFSFVFFKDKCFFWASDSANPMWCRTQGGYIWTWNPSSSTNKWFGAIRFFTLQGVKWKAVCRLFVSFPGIVLQWIGDNPQTVSCSLFEGWA